MLLQRQSASRIWRLCWLTWMNPNHLHVQACGWLWKQWQRILSLSNYREGSWLAMNHFLNQDAPIHASFHKKSCHIWWSNGLTNAVHWAECMLWNAEGFFNCCDGNCCTRMLSSYLHAVLCDMQGGITDDDIMEILSSDKGHHDCVLYFFAWKSSFYLIA